MGADSIDTKIFSEPFRRLVGARYLIKEFQYSCFEFSARNSVRVLMLDTIDMLDMFWYFHMWKCPLECVEEEWLTTYGL